LSEPLTEAPIILFFCGGRSRDEFIFLLSFSSVIWYLLWLFLVRIGLGTYNIVVVIKLYYGLINNWVDIGVVNRSDSKSLFNEEAILSGVI